MAAPGLPLGSATATPTPTPAATRTTTSGGTAANNGKQNGAPLTDTFTGQPYLPDAISTDRFTDAPEYQLFAPGGITIYKGGVRIPIMELSSKETQFSLGLNGAFATGQGLSGLSGSNAVASFSFNTEGLSANEDRVPQGISASGNVRAQLDYYVQGDVTTWFGRLVSDALYLKGGFGSFFSTLSCYLNHNIPLGSQEEALSAAGVQRTMAGSPYLQNTTTGWVQLDSGWNNTLDTDSVGIDKISTFVRYDFIGMKDVYGNVSHPWDAGLKFTSIATGSQFGGEYVMPADGTDNRLNFFVSQRVVLDKWSLVKNTIKNLSVDLGFCLNHVNRGSVLGSGSFGAGVNGGSNNELRLSFVHAWGEDKGAGALPAFTKKVASPTITGENWKADSPGFLTYEFYASVKTRVSPQNKCQFRIFTRNSNGLAGVLIQDPVTHQYYTDISVPLELDSVTVWDVTAMNIPNEDNPLLLPDSRKVAPVISGTVLPNSLDETGGIIIAVKPLAINSQGEAEFCIKVRVRVNSLNYDTLTAHSSLPTKSDVEMMYDLLGPQ